MTTNGWLALLLPFALGVLSQFLVSELTARRRLRDSRADRLMFENLGRRRDAYDTLFKALRELEVYFEKFMHPGCMGFHDIEDPATFAPLSSWDTFRKAADEVGLWLDEPTRKTLDQLEVALNSGSRHALVLVRTESELHDREPLAPEPRAKLEDRLNRMRGDVWDIAEHVLRDIETVKNTMRYSLGLTDLDAATAGLRRRLSGKPVPQGLPSGIPVSPAERRMAEETIAEQAVDAAAKPRQRS